MPRAARGMPSPTSCTTARSAAACSKRGTSSGIPMPLALKRTWRERRMSNAPLDQSGVWRYRELFPFHRRRSPHRHAARRQYAAAERPARRCIRRTRAAYLQASGLQPHRIVQRQRDDRRSRPGAPPRHEARGLRFDRQHFRLDGRLCQCRRARAAHLHPARQHLLRQAGAGSRIWREDVPGGSQFRPDPGAGARPRRAPGNLSAEFDQSRSASKARNRS